MTNIVSFSGGKDSTAMCLMMLERGIPVDHIVCFDGGWEFPEMYDHFEKFEKFTGRKIDFVKPDKPFDYYFSEHEKVKGDRKGKKGYGFPRMNRRWCTRIKIGTINRFLKSVDDPIVHIGIAVDENRKLDPKSKYPLVDWNVTEQECLDYCYERGFDWGGLYKWNTRVICWCCPLGGVRNARGLYFNRRDLFEKLKEMESRLQNGSQAKAFMSFNDRPLEALERQFVFESKQIHLMEVL